MPGQRRNHLLNCSAGSLLVRVAASWPGGGMLGQEVTSVGYSLGPDA